MNVDVRLWNLIENKVRVVTELREQLKLETERLNRYRIAQDVLSELDLIDTLRDNEFAVINEPR